MVWGAKVTFFPTKKPSPVCTQSPHYLNVSHKLPYQVALLLFLLNFTTKSYVRINFIRIYSNMSVWVLSIIHDYRYNKRKLKNHYKQRWHCNWDWSRKHLTWISNKTGNPNDTRNRGRNSRSTKHKRSQNASQNSIKKLTPVNRYLLSSQMTATFWLGPVPMLNTAPSMSMTTLKIF